MDIELNPNEARVIGCLIEKEIATPDQYPLSLNALVNACNQKSNREPVLNLDEATIQATVDGLRKKHLVLEKTGFGSRVAKYQHRFCNTEFSALQLTAQETAVLCELLLRGPQTPGELRSRASRLCPFADVQEVDNVLGGLAQRDGGPLVVQLAREPGRRESRYAHLFGGETAVPVQFADTDAGSVQGGEEDRVGRLERRVGQLEAALDEIRRRLDR